MDVEADKLKRKIEVLEDTVLRLESLIMRVESDRLREHINITAALDNLRRNQTGPRKFLGI